jgi:hypothetical protein
MLMVKPESLTFGDIDDTSRPLAIAVHGFPDTPHTWRPAPRAARLIAERICSWLAG